MIDFATRPVLRLVHAVSSFRGLWLVTCTSLFQESEESKKQTTGSKKAQAL